jgi:hypothetical protein
MGMDAIHIKFIIEMAKNKMFDGKIRSVMDFGTLDLQCASKDDDKVLDELYAVFGVTRNPASRVKMVDPKAKRCQTRDLYEELGFHYDCIDLDGRQKSLPWDLNFATCPPEYCGKYVLTTNFGITEHLLNQGNALSLMHDLTCVGGYMFHVLPCTGFYTHGYFHYTPLFYKHLASENNYNIFWPCLVSGTKETGWSQWAPIPSVSGTSPSSMYPPMSVITCRFEKTSDAPFKYPGMIWPSDGSLFDHPA